MRNRKLLRCAWCKSYHFRTWQPHSSRRRQRSFRRNYGALHERPWNYGYPERSRRRARTGQPKQTRHFRFKRTRKISSRRLYRSCDWLRTFPRPWTRKRRRKIQALWHPRRQTFRNHYRQYLRNWRLYQSRKFLDRTLRIRSNASHLKHPKQNKSQSKLHWLHPRS